jgi:hypothetical protein
MLPTSIIFIFRSGMQIWMLSSDSSCMWNTNWDFYHCSGKYYLKCIIHFFIRSYSNDDPLARKYKYILQKPFICTDENAYYCFFFWHKLLTLEFFEPIQGDALNPRASFHISIFACLCSKIYASTTFILYSFLFPHFEGGSKILSLS